MKREGTFRRFSVVFLTLFIDIALMPHCDFVTNGQAVTSSTLKGLHSFDDVLHLPYDLRTQSEKAMEYFLLQKIFRS